MEKRLTPSEFMVGDVVRASTGFTHYTILAVKESELGRLVARIDPEHPEYWADLADMVLVKRKQIENANRCSMEEYRCRL